MGILPVIVSAALVFNYILPSIYRYLNPKEYTVKHVLDNIPDRRPLLVKIKKEIDVKNLSSTLRKQKTIVVTGDSHAVDISLALQLHLADTDKRVALLHSICDPLALNSISVTMKDLYDNHPQDKTKRPKYCLRHHAEYLRNLTKHSPDLIIFSEAWRLDALPYLSQTIKEIKAASTAKVLILGRNFSFRQHPNVALRSLTNIDKIDEIAWEKRIRFDQYDTQLMKIAKDTGSYFLSKNDIVCPDQNCKILFDLEMGYTDQAHWSLVGMKYYGNILINHEIFKVAIND